MVQEKMNKRTHFISSKQLAQKSEQQTIYIENKFNFQQKPDYLSCKKALDILYKKKQTAKK